ncbi:MAG TPA: NAD(P)H-dependent oxidoreductase [Oxalicibacterium sp.]|uniref:NADPH-dependent FMN reductase n=1 Tax=Oxalicibacterium sp. TaxID=2766525 RepID=UPI002BADC272|nr:NAD(P)H-dependent oxidoreductase [Oxalicibacterium sp.]HWU98130.1 NAD(P)H-dependent oxidoreductase [Oxalicibacterium sp.]
MATEKIRVALIYGSTREGRFCDTVAQWAAVQTKKHAGFSLQVIDPADIDIPMRLQRNCAPELAALKTQLADVDAFIIVTPEYNHGYPAVLKHLIDSAYGVWQAKPVGFVSYGGLSGGVRAVEQLRQVFAEVHATTVRNTVSFMNAWEQFDRDGNLHDTDRAEQSMTMMLTQLHWWATALKQARSVQSYAEIAT